MGNNLLSQWEVINMYRQYNIWMMRLYEPNPAALQALGGSNIDVMLSVPNDYLQRFASSQYIANTWFQNNIPRTTVMSISGQCFET